jgi:hypothetical protein
MVSGSNNSFCSFDDNVFLISMMPKIRYLESGDYIMDSKWSSISNKTVFESMSLFKSTLG